MTCEIKIVELEIPLRGKHGKSRVGLIGGDSRRDVSQFLIHDEFSSHKLSELIVVEMVLILQSPLRGGLRHAENN